MADESGIIQNFPAGKILSQPSLFDPNNETVWLWAQDSVSPDEATVTTSNGIATMDGWLLDPTRLTDAVAFFVGYSWVDYSVAAATRPLLRSLPVFHPLLPYFRCTGVSIKGCLIDQTTLSAANFTGKYTTTVKLPVPNYKKYRLQLKFEQPKYNVYPDSLTGPNGDANREWDRYLDPADPTDETEIITVDGGQYLYNYPTSGAKPDPVVINGPSVKVYAQRQGLMIRAHNIASDFVMNENGMMPKFMAAKGHVNSVQFLGNAPGTMLLTTYKPYVCAQPVSTAVMDANLLGLDIDMTFIFTGPPRAEAGETRSGWQLLPPPKGGNAAGWFGVYPKGHPSENLYPTYDMYELLKYWGNGYTA